MEVVLEFTNLSYIIDDKNNIHIQSTGTDTEKLNSSHIDILFDYLRILDWNRTQTQKREKITIYFWFSTPLDK